jgi:hypothetical protein
MWLNLILSADVNTHMDHLTLVVVSLSNCKPRLDAEELCMYYHMISEQVN